MIPFQITKRNNKLKVLAIGIARNFDHALELAKKAGYPVTDYGIHMMPRDSYHAIKERGKIPVITARDELPEGPGLELVLRELKDVRKELKRLRGEGGCSVEELAAYYEQIGKAISESMPKPDHPTSTIELEIIRVTEARALFNYLVWIPPDQRKHEDVMRLKQLVELISGDYQHGSNGTPVEVGSESSH